MGNEFNQSVNKLPPKLTHLTTGNEFNQPVDKLPPTLMHLTTGNKFNQAVNKIPPKLTHLTTRDQSQPVDKLPPTFTTGNEFNRPAPPQYKKQPPSLKPTQIDCAIC
jgi:FNIP Repeat